MNPYQAPSGGPPPRAFETSELGPKAIFMAIANGDGFAKPRIVGAVWSAIGVLLLVWNVFLILATAHYFIWMAAITPMFLLAGAFMLVTGEPLDRGYPAPKWARAGLGACFFGGIALGALLAVVLHV